MLALSIMERITGLSCIVWLLLSVIHQGHTEVQYMCQSEDIQLRSEHMEVILNSLNYPNQIPGEAPRSNDCFIYITAAADLKIEVTLVDIGLPNCSVATPPQGSCVYGCDHLYMYEPDAPSQSSHYIMGGQITLGKKITTFTRRLYIKFCRHFLHSYTNTRFSLALYTLKKTETIGVVSNRNYYFTSRFFPDEYNIWSGDDVYHYTIIVEKALQPVFLNFTDLNLHPQSQIRILYGQNTLDVRKRPFLMLSNSRFSIEFDTGKDPTESYKTPVYPHYLWRAEITPQTSESGLEVSDCGKYFYDVWGGQFKVSDSTSCGRNVYLDCVFVVARKQRENNCFSSFILRFNRLGLQHELGDSLEVRAGTTSQGPLLWKHFDETSKVFRGQEGYYIHFRGVCRYGGVRLAAVFASTRPITSGTCMEPSTMDSFKCGNNEARIPPSLLCDGAEHCYDGTDESRLLCTGSTTELLCDAQDLLSCNEVFSEKYCPQHSCDGTEQCPGGEDEDNCQATDRTMPVDEGTHFSWGTIIPISLSCLVVVFILCVFVALFMKMKRARSRHPSQSHHRPTPHSPFDQYRGCDLPAPDDLPPAYDEAVRRPPSVTHVGYVNSGFSLLPPPPYSPPLNQTTDETQGGPLNPASVEPLSVRGLAGHSTTGSRLYRDDVPLEPSHSNRRASSSDQNNRLSTSTGRHSNPNPEDSTLTEVDTRTNAPEGEDNMGLRLQQANNTGIIKSDTDLQAAVKDVTAPEQLDATVTPKKRHGKKSNKKSKANSTNKQVHQASSVSRGGEADSCDTPDLRHKQDGQTLEISTHHGSRETAV